MVTGVTQLQVLIDYLNIRFMILALHISVSVK